jgi:hypothetical protein
MKQETQTQTRMDGWNMIRNRVFYLVKPLIPRQFQLYLRRHIARRRQQTHAAIWPVDEKAGTAPASWCGWPDGRKFSFVLMHDVDTQQGHDQVGKLMELEEHLGFRSIFNIVPERYTVSAELRQEIKSRGFEVGVHGLKHDGKLFTSKSRFNRSAARINGYLKEWHSEGFSAPSMLRNLEWIHALNMKHDTSTFDTDPFEPEPFGIGTIFPFWVPRPDHKGGYVELPYTLVQDFTLFLILGQRDISIWKRKLDWIAGRGGMALLNTHPDYMNFDKKSTGPEKYPSQYYKDFLTYVSTEYKDRYWHATSGEMARFWRKNMVKDAGEKS